MHSKYKVQVVAILIGCVLIGVVVVPSVIAGKLDPSMMAFVKAVGLLFSAILYGVFATQGGGHE